MDKEITYDFSRLNFEELLEFRALQSKMRRETGSIEGYEALTVDELRQLEKFYYKMKGEAYPWDHAAVHVTVIGREFTDGPVIPSKAPSSGVAAASVTSRPEPVAIAPAAAPANPVAPATPAPAEKLKRPAEDVMSAAHQLDGLMRFGA